LAAILDPVPGAWFFTRRDTRFAYVSAGACQWLGYDKAQLMSKTLLDVDPTLTAERWEWLWNSTKPPDSMTVRTVHQRADGTRFPVEVRAVRVLLSGEDFAVSYAVDLTQSEETRAALLATEAQLERLLSNLPDLIFRVCLRDPPTFQFASPSAEGLLGFSPSELTAEHAKLADFVYPEDIETFLSLGSLPHGTGPRVRFFHRDGHTVWMDLRATARTEGTPAPSIEGVARDVTQTHDAELFNQRLLTAIEQVAEAVVITDLTGKVLYVNPAYTQSTGRSHDDSIGRSWAELEVRADDAFLKVLGGVLASGESWKGRIASVRSSVADAYDEEVSVSPLRNPSGAVVGRVAVKRDITERLRLQEQLNQAQKLEAVGQLAGGVAHDFNNLLQIVQGNSLLIKSKVGCPELESLAQGVLDASQRASSLVRQLLTFRRKGTVEFSPVDVADCVWGLRPMLERLMGAAIQVSWKFNSRPSVVIGNSPQLQQVIVNLCINARDAMAEGGNLLVDLRNVDTDALPPGVRQRRPHLLLTVVDDGHGMDDTVCSRLFEPFFSTKEAGRGSGLGLATVYAIVRAHGGCIDVDSTPGQGATFRVHLPLSDAPLSCEKSARQPEVLVRGAGRLVLVADDEEGVRDLTTRFLREAGFDVLEAADGTQALEVLQKRRDTLCLAVLDVVMPSLGGLALFERLTEQGSSLPVIFVTGFDRDALADVVDEPRVRIVTKPFDSASLLSRVAQLLPESTGP
jgi:two-component system NtrC family sensor kinase